MSKNLVIVESPAKAKTIEKYLGSDFKVVSSYGHISDLPSNELGVDVDQNFKPKYIISKDKKDVVRDLKKKAKSADYTWLASDEDREGEAIAWHLFENLDLDINKTKRIVFREITKNAILNAIENPREINYNLVNAQQARRVIDRLVGFKISPILWRKVKGGLSAGRVQSVAVRLIVDREKEINDFEPTSSFKVTALFQSANGDKCNASLSKVYDTNNDVRDLLNKSIDAIFSVADINKKPFKKSPSPPFTTSTLQQEASGKLGFSVGRTMTTAQKLYESGHITYMRTDSVNLSNDAVSSAKKVIANNYGDNYSSSRAFSNKNKGAQEAHEAVRPTNFERFEVDSDSDQSRLYKLIWQRSIASQMSEALLERTIFKITTDKYESHFTVKGEVVKFDGFLKVYNTASENIQDDEKNDLIPEFKLGEDLNNLKIVATQKFSKPPFRFSEAALVKKMEDLGIGRPSTYAPTITTIQNRKYVSKGVFEGDERMFSELTLENKEIHEKQLKELTGSDKGKLVPTEVGIIVTDFLVNNFKNILDFNFTARVEKDFDSIANGSKNWTKMLEQFYSTFQPNVDDVKENAARETGERFLGNHPESGKKVIVRLGKFGPMVQIGTVDDEDKPIFAGLLPNQKIGKITLQESLELFRLPCYLGDFEEEKVESNVGRFGPYLKHKNTFTSLPKGVNPLEVTLDQAVDLILEKRKNEAPIGQYEDFDITKGKGRFGPFIKWNGMFINVNKSYDFENLTNNDLEQLIEAKKKKEAEKVIKVWDEENIRVEKARWGRFNIFKGKLKLELPKETKIEKLTKEKILGLFEKKTKKKSKK